MAKGKSLNAPTQDQAADDGTTSRWGADLDMIHVRVNKAMFARMQRMAFENKLNKGNYRYGIGALLQEILDNTLDDLSVEDALHIFIENPKPLRKWLRAQAGRTH